MPNKICVITTQKGWGGGCLEAVGRLDRKSSQALMAAQNRAARVEQERPQWLGLPCCAQGRAEDRAGPLKAPTVWKAMGADKAT